MDGKISDALEDHEELVYFMIFIRQSIDGRGVSVGPGDISCYPPSSRQPATKAPSIIPTQPNDKPKRFGLERSYARSLASAPLGTGSGKREKPRKATDRAKKRDDN